MNYISLFDGANENHEKLYSTNENDFTVIHNKYSTQSISCKTNNARCVAKLSETCLGLMVFNATFNNILVISWQLILLEEETECTWRKPLTCHKSLTNFIT